MKFICDVHLPYKLVHFLNNQQHEAVHVNSLENKWFTDDDTISHYEDNNNMVVISKDEDFRTSYFLKHKPKKFIHVTLGNISNNELIEIFSKNMLIITHYMQQETCLLEIGKNYIEVYS